MDEQQDYNLPEGPEMKVLPTRAHEYVVNFRNRFLTYFALPLFLVFLAIALFISWLVHVPIQQEFDINLSNQNLSEFSLPESVRSQLTKDYESIITAQIQFLDTDNKLQKIDYKVESEGMLTTNLVYELPQEFTDAKLVVTTDEERFLHKLLDELVKNISVKKPVE